MHDQSRAQSERHQNACAPTAQRGLHQHEQIVRTGQQRQQHGCKKKARPARVEIMVGQNGPSLELYFNKGIFVFVGVDHIVLDTSLAIVRLGRFHIREYALLISSIDAQPAIHRRHDHVVVLVAMPARLRTRGKAPLRDARGVIVNQNGCS